ncbi:hypothetical protein GCK32_002909 [Trichostrongylus colubriformis]|uniref:G-protein coupled receptors family 1 profile domain-containing protein n=1 Tax=Trichostrongylus colubriformis TaxID=6319 RepID=A0AAN8G185_TRICO
MSAVAYNDRTDEIIAGIIMLTVSFLGNVLNISAVVLIYRTPHFHNAFGFICASHLLADVGLLSIYFFWAAPATILGYSEQLSLSYFGKQMGQLIMMFWYASIYGQLQIALNRLLAIFSPVLYSSTFTIRRTKQILAAFWLLSIAHVIVYFVDGCYFVYDIDSFTWLYAYTKCGGIISFYLDFAHGTSLCIIVIIIDTIAFFGIIREVKKISQSIGSAPEAAMLRKNTRLYLMGCAQAVCFALMISSFHILSRFMTNRWTMFATTTFVWELAHATDGLILIAFHEKFRVVLCQPSLIWQKKSRSILAVTIQSRTTRV